MSDKLLGALYQTTRLQVVTAPDPTVFGTKHDAYIYAWQNNVYPALHDTIGFHAPFASAFDVSAEQTLALSNYIQSQRLAGASMSFGDLENHFCEKSDGDTIKPMTRGNLIATCRYLKLTQVFTTAFWTNVVKDYLPDVKTIAT